MSPAVIAREATTVKPADKMITMGYEPNKPNLCKTKDSPSDTGIKRGADRYKCVGKDLNEHGHECDCHERPTPPRGDERHEVPRKATLHLKQNHLKIAWLRFTQVSLCERRVLQVRAGE